MDVLYFHPPLRSFPANLAQFCLGFVLDINDVVEIHGQSKWPIEDLLEVSR